MSDGRSPLLIVGIALIALALVGGGALVCLGGLGVAMFTALPGEPAPAPGVGVIDPGLIPTTPTPTVATDPPGEPATLEVPLPPSPTRPFGLIGPEHIAEAEPERWHDLQAEPPTPLVHFDALQSLAWAQGLARRWRPDATLGIVFVDHLQRNGHLNLVDDPDAQVDYRFASPAQIQLRDKLAEVTEAEVPTGLRVWIQEGQIRIMITEVDLPEDRDGGLDPRWAPFEGVGRCDQRRLLEAIEAQPDVPRRPSYGYRLDWRWPVQSYVIDTDPGGAYLDPATCAPKAR